MSQHGIAYALRVLAPNGPIKIGFTSKNPALRATAIAMTSPYHLEWFALWATDKREDTETLRRFAPYAIKREWFYPVKPVLDFIHEKCPVFDAKKSYRDLLRVDLRDKLFAVHAEIPKNKVSGVRHDLYRLLEKHSGVSSYAFSEWMHKAKAPSPAMIDAVVAYLAARNESAAA